MERVVQGKSGTHIAIAHLQKGLFLQMRRGVTFKRCRAKLLEKTCNYPDF